MLIRTEKPVEREEFDTALVPVSLFTDYCISILMVKEVIFLPEGSGIFNSINRFTKPYEYWEVKNCLFRLGSVTFEDSLLPAMRRARWLSADVVESRNDRIFIHDCRGEDVGLWN